MQFPFTRLRRNRKEEWLRDLISESKLTREDLIYPLFVIEGSNIKEPIKMLPGVFRLSIDKLVEEVGKAVNFGIKAIALFPVIEGSLKSEDAGEAYNLDNLICRAVRAVKNLNLPIGIICDVALDPYTDHGHDGIIVDSEVDNDKTLEALSLQALTLAKAGADIVAPSDMMDGRIGTVRNCFEEEGFPNVGIIAYSAKYASNFYGPFRDAVGSAANLKNASKHTYQMDYRNIKEALLEIELDIKEGADIILIKPGISCSDVIYAANSKFNVPIFAYQVSGEYAMLKHAALSGCFSWEKAMIESLYSIKRAGARAIFTYAALEIATLL